MERQESDRLSGGHFLLAFLLSAKSIFLHWRRLMKLLSMIGVFLIAVGAHAFTIEDMAAQNLGKKTGTYSISKEICSLEVEGLAEDGPYMLLFDQSNYMAGAATYNTTAWSTNAPGQLVSYSHDCGVLRYVVHFYFDTNLKIYSYNVEGDPRGNCILSAIQ